jgi:hypothetical protein
VHVKRLEWSIASIIVLAVGFAVGRTLLGDANASDNSLLVVSSQWSAFGALFVLTLALERAIEPFSDVLGPNTTEASQTAGESGNKDDKRVLTDARRLTALVTFSVATAVAWVLAGGLKILLLSAIVDTTKGSAPNTTLDLLVTGLVVGAGTKPLHDLVSNLQKTSEAKSKSADK